MSREVDNHNEACHAFLDRFLTQLGPANEQAITNSLERSGGFLTSFSRWLKRQLNEGRAFSQSTNPDLDDLGHRVRIPRVRGLAQLIDEHVSPKDAQNTPSVLEGRRLAITAKGHLAVVPIQAKQGDSIIIGGLNGLGMPVVRPLSSQNSKSWDKKVQRSGATYHVQFVGLCDLDRSTSPATSRRPKSKGGSSTYFIY